MKSFLAIPILAATALACAWTEARAIESRLASDVAAAVTASGLDQVVATVDGRDVVLEGSVPNVERKQFAGQAIDAIEGVRTVANRLKLDVDIATRPEAAAGVPPPPPVDCQTRIDELLVTGRIDFESSSAELRETSSEMLARLAEIVGLCGDRRIEIAGHTDASGPRDENLELSLRRAESVLDYLAASGVDRDRLTAVGYGPDSPLVSNETPEGRAVNRRIEFEVQGPS